MGFGQGSVEGVAAGMSEGFWRGRPVFLTGHTGFKGTWMSLWLQRLGARLTGYSLPGEPDPATRMFEQVGAAEGMTSLEGDVRDSAALEAALLAAQPEVVFHFAAQPLVRRSYRDPLATFDVNVMGTARLLEACRRCDSVRAVVVITTDKCYENREWPWGYREDEAMGGHDPYSASKGAAELVTAAFRRSYFDAQGTHRAHVASARAGNVIGGGDWAEDRLVPDMIRAFVRGEAVRIRSPRSVRPWQHVLEPLGGYLLLARRLLERGAPFAEGWNFGPEDADAREVGWIVEYLTRGWGDGASFTLDRGDHPHEAATLRLDISKARQRLPWQPRLRLDQALDWLIEWYRAAATARGDTRRMRELTLSQIAAYEALIPSASSPC